MNDISKAKITIHNLLNKKDFLVQSIIENISKIVDADLNEE